MKRIVFLLTLLAILGALALTACGSSSPAVKTFVPLQPPAFAKNRANIFVTTVGKDAENVEIVSPLARVTYLQTAEGTGQIASEIIELLTNRKIATMEEVQWGDYLAGTVRMTEYYGTNQDVLGGVVMYEIKNASFFQVILGKFSYIFDRSRVYMVYVNNGESLELKTILYTEEWGSNDKSIIAMGSTAMWWRLEGFPTQYKRWGYWEKESFPFDVVTQAIEQVRRFDPRRADFLSVDEDSIREIIDRQTGFKFSRSGRQFGQVNLWYANNFGNMPNTPMFGKGALSRVDWQIGKDTYTLLVLTPELSPVGSSLFVFTKDQSQADALLRRVETAQQLYDLFRREQVPGAFLVVHAIGGLKKATDTTSVSTSDGSKDVTVEIGTTGGIAFATLGPVTHENVTLARNLFSMLGRNGTKALGFHYGTKVEKGSSLNYYLSLLYLATAPSEKVLDVWGLDVGELDRVGFPNQAWIESLP